MLWIATLVVAVFLLAVAALAVTAALSAEFAPVETLARHGMKVGHGAAAIIVLAVLGDYLQGHRPDELWISAGYAVATLGVPTLILTQQPYAEGSPSEPPHLYVIAVVAVATAVLVFRLVQTW